ncbi:MAG: OmpA family protein [Ignavibacteriales bacterium]|nr:MAG: OmpA family protein [Ignavibacteriales bacterium]
MDKCKNTPAKVEVDQNGCPLDTDKDGVPDYLDECPGTPEGSEVDSRGCIIFDEVAETVLSANTNFEFGKWDLLPSAYPVLDNITEVMKLKPETKWRVEGHTDNVGSDKYNDRLSLDRAQAVVNYFVSKGIDRKRFDVAGLGKKYPVTSNDTEEGRSQNRRVVIIKIN